MSETSLSKEYINEILSQVATNLKLLNWKYDVHDFESIGQNYFGIIIPVNLTGNKDKETINYQVVLKLAPTDARYRVSGAVTVMFNREVFVYTKLLSKYKEIQDFYLTQHYHIPTLYFSRDEYCKEVIAMRDMREAGFKPFTHATFLDLDHITIALNSLAHFHAMSFFLYEEDYKLYNKVKEECVPLTEKSNKRFMDIMIDRLVKAVSNFEGTVYQPLLENLKMNCSKFYDDIVTLAKGSCICHGDIWKENILFMYKDNKPVEACIIDYQTTRMSSPAFDVLYLIISSTDAKLRNEHYYNLLTTYYESFKQHLEDFQMNCELVYPRELFDFDIKLVAPACLITANTAMWLSHGLQQEGHVRSKKIIDDPEEKSKALERYKTVIKGIIDNFYSYGYLLTLKGTVA